MSESNPLTNLLESTANARDVVVPLNRGLIQRVVGLDLYFRSAASAAIAFWQKPATEKVDNATYEDGYQRQVG